MQNLAFETEFLRIPGRDQRCSVSGLSRTAVEELVVPSKKNGFNPPIKAKLHRKPGSLRGVWLIPKREYLAYFNNLPTSR